MTGSCLLFVDDEEGFLELYRAAFSRDGYAVATAASVDLARERLEQGGVELVVLDIRLGETSGLALLREIKAADAHMPVVLATYARYQDDFSSWLADAYIVKSSDLGELKQAVRRCLKPPVDPGLGPRPGPDADPSLRPTAPSRCCRSSTARSWNACSSTSWSAACARPSS